MPRTCHPKNGKPFCKICTFFLTMKKWLQVKKACILGRLSNGATLGPLSRVIFDCRGVAIKLDTKSPKTITGSITALLRYTLGLCSKNTKIPILYGLNGTLGIYFYRYTFLWCNKRGYISFFQWSIVNKWNVSTSSVLWIMRSLHKVWSKAKLSTLIHNQ